MKSRGLEQDFVHQNLFRFTDGSVSISQLIILAIRYLEQSLEEAERLECQDQFKTFNFC